ncbi:hypothetical protein FSARC_965 [Fusarium sarcochroum]|uniref:Choline transport protein n=1 Tax=Fusarium sarcochroum TaxID=1208366 RepID=A0A8H4U9S2_9HYPO|nr:hypothetical protein FSARC_965 [Fusarium sarcochroum]
MDNDIKKSLELEKHRRHDHFEIAEGSNNMVLEQLGLESQMKKDIGPFAILCVGFNICNSWVGLAATMVIGMEQGGSITVIYGMIVVLVCLGCSALTMAELSSVYPTAGGPYHWTSILAPSKVNGFMSYTCAVLNIFGWLSITSGVVIQPGQFIEAMRIFFHPEVEPSAWQYFLFFQAVNIVALVHNNFLQRRIHWVHDVGFIFSLTSFAVITITCLSRTSSYNSNDFVWKTFINKTGWNSDAVVFLTGMANPNFMFAGIDGAVHLAEEVTDAAKTVPRALMSTIAIGFTTAFAFPLAMLYSLDDFDKVLENATGRCPDLRNLVPVWALVANSAVIFIIGCIYLGSTSAFNAFIGSGLLLQQCSFAMPAGLLLWHRRAEKVLPESRPFKLGALGWVANLVTLLFAPLITIMYCFPVELPVAAGTMMVGVMAMFAAVNWFLYGRKHYKGPRLPAM